MIERVVTTLTKSENVGRIQIVIEDATLLKDLPGIQALITDGTVTFVKSEKTLSQSVMAAIRAGGSDGLPYFITTADNCLHTPAIIDHFLNEVSSEKADAAWAMTNDKLVQETYPGTGKITGQHKLTDGIWSNCNIYAVCSEEAFAAIELFKAGGQFGNKKKRKAMIPMIGLWSFFLYRFGLVSLSGLAKRASKLFGIHAVAVKMPFADAPIDADDLVSYNFIADRLAEREK
ncbi:hypothetical protein GCM10017044_02160 [Kordiimonas sediminis]|uniref:MobA-like NTP transferase domain-containing protein n=2 Tax=Kordiimonas sediminis TaxID=1735581 RepID=A0A919AKF8_9PROT|nr:hypothetical protein GCM10017044_02160 [Kordiimonas sediminis]